MILRPDIARHNQKICEEWIMNSTPENKKLFCAFAMGENKVVSISCMNGIKNEDLVNQLRVIANELEKQQIKVNGANG